MFNSILNREPEPPSQFNPKLPVHFDDILAKALEKDRSLRYQTAAELRADLKRLKRDSGSGRVQVPNRPAGAAETPKPIWLWLSAIVAAALVGGLAIAWWFLSGQRFERKAGERASVPSIPFTSLPGEERHPALSPDGKQIAFAWNGGHGVDWRLYVKQLGVEHPLPLTTNAGVVYSPAWSPDGLEIAFYRQSGAESNAQSCLTFFGWTMILCSRAAACKVPKRNETKANTIAEPADNTDHTTAVSSMAKPIPLRSIVKGNCSGCTD